MERERGTALSWEPKRSLRMRSETQGCDMALRGTGTVRPCGGFDVMSYVPNILHQAVRNLSRLNGRNLDVFDRAVCLSPTSELGA